MAQYAEETAHQSGHHDPHGDERMNREIRADREWMFEMFVRIGAWSFALAFVILALLALTQT